MKEDNKYIVAKLLKSTSALLERSEKLGVNNLPLELSGTTADLLYREGVKNTVVVDIVDILAQDVSDKSASEIIDRFKLIEKVLTSLQRRIDDSVSEK